MKHASAIGLSLAAVLALGACQTSGTRAAQVASPPPPPTYVEAICAFCHGVERAQISPNPEAPSLEAVANRPGVTRATIQAWLRNAHNYPAQMDFELTPENVEEISDYMITLRRQGFVPHD